ncbi:hypothetical protein H9P43_005557 [Blastocladiella emersonii ATCC 22665]|nr:hypothetical protein H9P43_005557 [Blastocladiella emersonii ATCC 22665]
MLRVIGEIEGVSTHFLPSLLHLDEDTALAFATEIHRNFDSNGLTQVLTQAFRLSFKSWDRALYVIRFASDYFPTFQLLHQLDGTSMWDFLASRFAFQPTIDAWPVFLLFTAAIKRFRAELRTESVFAGLEWIPVAVLADSSLRPNALQHLTDSGTALDLLNLMIRAQLNDRVGRYALELSFAERTCGACAPSTQPAWFVAVSELHRLCTQNAPIPKSVRDKLLASLGNSGCDGMGHDALELRLRTRIASSCGTQHVAFPELELWRTFLEFKVVDVVEVLTYTRGRIPLAILELLPRAAFDRPVVHPRWLAQLTVAYERVGDHAGAAQMRRLSLVKSSTDEYLLAYCELR